MCGKLQIQLLGKFEIVWGGHPLAGLEGKKTQELLSYLLLNANIALSREKLAHILWPSSSSTFQAKKYLRKTIWKIQSAFNIDSDLQTLLKVDAEWIEIDPVDWVCVDISHLEEAYYLVEGNSGEFLDIDTVNLLDSVVYKYQGEFLEGLYVDWSIFVRERFELMFLILLDKLMIYCEANGHYEKGCFYGLNILRYDPAREQTHRRMMRLYAKAKMRTEAIRQFYLCTQILKDELDVEPGQLTRELFFSIQEKNHDFDLLSDKGDEVSLNDKNLVNCFGRVEASVIELKQIIIQNSLA